jgi:hypothetical protein
MQVTFLIDPWLKPVGNSDKWELVDHFTVRIEEDNKPALILTVPRGFQTDLASVPRLPFAYMVFNGKARRSAILHDYLYSEQYPRAWADAVFLAAMESEVGPVRRRLMYWGGRLAGGSRYQDHQLANEAEREAP